MKKITHYRRGSSANWIAFPQTTLVSARRFVLLGTYKELRLEDEDGTVSIIAKDQNNVGEKLLAALA